MLCVPVSTWNKNVPGVGRSSRFKAVNGYPRTLFILFHIPSWHLLLSRSIFSRVFVVLSRRELYSQRDCHIHLHSYLRSCHSLRYLCKIVLIPMLLLLLTSSFLCLCTLLVPYFLQYCIATTIRSRDVTCDTLPRPFTILGDLWHMVHRFRIC